MSARDPLMSLPALARLGQRIGLLKRLASASSNLLLPAGVAAWAAAGALLVLAANGLRLGHSQAELEQLRTSAAAYRLVVESSPLERASLQRIVERVQPLYRAVRIAEEGGLLVITSSDREESFAEWLSAAAFALATLDSESRGGGKGEPWRVRWEIEKACASGSCAARGYSLALRGTRLALKIVRQEGAPAR